MKEPELSENLLSIINKFTTKILLKNSNEPDIDKDIINSLDRIIYFTYNSGFINGQLELYTKPFENEEH